MPTHVKHKFQSGKADGPDATLARPSAWNDNHEIGLELTNKSGSQRTAGDACVLNTSADESFTTTTTQGDLRPLVVVRETIANDAAGFVQNTHLCTVNVQGNVARGNWLRFSTTAGRLEDTGVAITAARPAGANAVALTAYAGGGAGTVEAVLVGSNAVLFKIASFTRDMATASGNQAVTGIGFKPRLLVLFASCPDEAGLFSLGFSDVATDMCIYGNRSAGTAFMAADLTNVIHIQKTAAADNYKGQINSFDADGWTVAWVRGGSIGGTVTVVGLAIGG